MDKGLKLVTKALVNLVVEEKKFFRTQSLTLQRRSLIEKSATSFTLQPVVRLYFAQKLMEQTALDMTNPEAALLEERLYYFSVLYPTITKSVSDRKS